VAIKCLRLEGLDFFFYKRIGEAGYDCVVLVGAVESVEEERRRGVIAGIVR